MPSTEEVKTMIEAGIPGARARVKDSTGTGDHFEAMVVAAKFSGTSRVQQHQMVYRALGDAMSGPIHALALRTFTPDERKLPLEES